MAHISAESIISQHQGFAPSNQGRSSSNQLTKMHQLLDRGT